MDGKRLYFHAKCRLLATQSFRYILISVWYGMPILLDSALKCLITSSSILMVIVLFSFLAYGFLIALEKLNSFSRNSSFVISQHLYVFILYIYYKYFQAGTYLKSPFQPLRNLKKCLTFSKINLSKFKFFIIFLGESDGKN